MARKATPTPDKTTFLITDRAGPFVAGVRVEGIEPDKSGRRFLSLTADQASYELILGSIEPVAPEAPRSKRSDD